MDRLEFSSVLEPKTAGVWAEQIAVSSPATALSQVEDGMRTWYSWQPGILFPYRMWDIAPPVDYSGLTSNQTLFVLVPLALVHARRREYVRSFARRMGMREQAQLEAYCEEAVRDVIEDPSPRSPPAFEADALARRVASWLRLFASRQVPHTADWLYFVK